MKFGIICKPSEESYRVAEKVYRMLDDVMPEKKFAEWMNEEGYEIEEIGKKADMIVVVGGDGTVLLTLHHTDKPVLPINTGRVGFLAELEGWEAEEGIKRILDGDYDIEERIRLKLLINGKRLADASNEVAMHISNIGKLLMMKLYVNDSLTENIYGDGLIVATPTGSTSYALSVGGPIVDPGLNVFVVAPMAPFRHISSPIVMPSDKKLKVEVNKDTKVAVDGMVVYDITPEDTVEIGISEKTANFVKIKDNFYARLYRKLSFRSQSLEEDGD